MLGAPADESGLEVRVIALEEFTCLAAPGFVRPHDRATAAALRSRRWIAFDRDLAMLAPWWRAGFGRREPLPAKAVCHVANLDEMLALCAEGVGLTVLPRYFLAESLAAGSVVEVKPAAGLAHGRHAKNPLKLAWRRGAVETGVFRVARDVLAA